MLKDFQDERITLHYSGRDYDHVCQKLATEEDRRKNLKQKLLAKLSLTLAHQDQDLVRQIFMSVDEVLN